MTFFYFILFSVTHSQHALSACMHTRMHTQYVTACTVGYTRVRVCVGDDGDNFYILDSGTCDCFVRSHPTKPPVLVKVCVSPLCCVYACVCVMYAFVCVCVCVCV